MRAKNKLGVNEKTAWVLGFCIPKKRQILEHFAMSFHQALASYF